MHIPPLGAIFGYLVFLLCLAVFSLCVYALIGKRYHLFQWIKKLGLIICLLYLGSMLSITWLIADNAFEYKLVYEVANLAMPLHQKLSGLWANQNSSLNFWCFLLVIANWISLCLADKHQSDRGKITTTLIFTFLIIVFLVPVVFIMNPFSRLWVTEQGTVDASVWVSQSARILFPENGVGLNPSLRHPAMLIHPPLLYLGLIGFFIPYTHAISALLVKADSAAWRSYTKSISLFAWMCLTAGMVLGSWWAYTILGWGGYWGWDAVEIAGLIPWLLSIGFVHSLAKGKSKDSHQVWSYIFIAGVFIFTLLGIFITRSGVLESVHAYAKGPVGPILSILVVIFSVLTISQLIVNRKRLSFVKKVNWDMTTNLLLIALSIFYFVGQTFPITTQIFSGVSRSFSSETYEVGSLPFIFMIFVGINQYYFKHKNNRPAIMNNIIAVIVAFIGAVLFIIWISSDLIPTTFFTFIIFLISKFILEGISVFVKSMCANKSRARKMKINIKRIGGYLIHFGFTLMLMGMLGVEHGTQQVPISLSVGEHETIEGITITNVSIQQFREEEPRMIYENGLDLSLGGKQPVRLTPRIEVYEKTGVRTSIPAIYTSPWKDVQLVLQDWGGANKENSIEVLLFPLALWIWVGSGLMVLGAGFSLIKQKPTNTSIIQPELDIISHSSIR